MAMEKYRQDFPLFEKRFNGKHLIYFDNAAMTLKPKQAVSAMDEYYLEYPANVHRGLHKLSEKASMMYEGTHSVVGKFIGAKPEEIVFTRNTTDSINTVMYSLLEKGFFQKGDEIVVSRMEHHSNLVPWQFVEKKAGIHLKFVELNKDFSLDMKDFEEKVTKKTRLVSLAHVSNTVASINPVKEAGKIAHDSGALFLVDAAQSVPHMPFDAKKVGADFAAFSGYKMCGPTGIGVLYGREDLLKEMQPFEYGGSMIKTVSWHDSEWANLPDKFEAGTPNIAEAIGLKAAVEYLQKIGLQNIREHEKELTGYALKRMQEIKGLKLFCPMNPEKQGGIVLFDTAGIEAHDIALALDESANIAIRSGMHCAEPIVSSLNPKGLCRASFYFYNTKKEIDVFCDTLAELMKAFT